MTRSRARQNPDQYTIIPASLKIVKVLVDELLSATQNLDTKAGGDVQGPEDDDADEEDEDWEDEPNAFLDLGLGATKEQLMAYGEGGDAKDAFGDRGRDDETQAYLLVWFREQAGKAGFGDVFAALSVGEQEKLRALS